MAVTRQLPGQKHMKQKSPVYISSSCSKYSELTESLSHLYLQGHKSIELSGGCQFNATWKSDMRQLEFFHDLSLRLHNYFPTPKVPFVLNLASKSNETVDMSFDLIERALQASAEIGADVYSIHAGFCTELTENDLGKVESEATLEREGCIDRFLNNAHRAQNIAKTYGIKLYIENNVISYPNFVKFGHKNPFLFCKSEEINCDLLGNGFDLLLDVAHLKVSTRTLGLNFEKELKNLALQTDYFHVSDNNTLEDQNLAIPYRSELGKQLSQLHTDNNILDNKVTIEVYSGDQAISETLNTIETIRCNAHR